MAALTQRRLVSRATGERYTDPVGAGVRIHEGAITVLDGGWLVPGATGLGLRARGIAAAHCDNTGGGNGALRGEVNTGVFCCVNDGSITRVHIGLNAYIVDDQTVAATNGGGTRSIAGLIKDVTAEGVWVRFE